MRAGPLRHRVQIQSTVRAITSAGGRSETWSTDRTTWASIDPISGRELFSEGAVQADITHRIRLRYSPGLSVRHRIKFGTRIFNIKQAINFAERGISHEVLATEVV